MKYHEVSAQQESFIWAGICAEQSRTDPDQTPTQKKLRKLSGVIFWLAKLRAPTLQKCRSRHVRVVDLSPFSTFLANFFLTTFPPSILYPLPSPPPSSFPSSTHPCCWGLCFPYWTPGSAPPLSHGTDSGIQSCRVQSHQLNVHAYSTARHITRPLWCYASEESCPGLTFRCARLCNLSAELTLHFHSHQQVGGMWSHLEWWIELL